MFVRIDNVERVGNLRHTYYFLTYLFTGCEGQNSNSCVYVLHLWSLMGNGKYFGELRPSRVAGLTYCDLGKYSVTRNRENNDLLLK